MLSDAQIQRVWENMLAAEVRANYFADLVGRYNQQQKYLTWGTLVASSAAAGAVILNLPEWLAFLRLLLPLGAAATSLFSLVQQNQKRAQDAAELHLRWNRLAADYERLWENTYAEDAAERLDTLTERSADVSKSGTSFPNEPEVLARWQDHVVGHRLQQFQHQN